jgi:hypothetical protein
MDPEKVTFFERFAPLPACPQYMKPIQHNTYSKTAVMDFTFPDNLTRLASAGELVQWSLEAVQTFFWSNRPDGPTPVAVGAFNPRVLLTLLTYSYAAGIYNSTTISAQCEHDDILQYLSMGIKYMPDRIRLFRGQNAPLLKRSLAFVIRRVYERAILSGSSKSTNPATWSVAIGQQEAQWRFQRAMQMDNAAPSAARASDWQTRPAGCEA